ncbi:MAG: hypothetical protein DMF72_13325 [Acidobacteria bacterium]|nr:MAG: hypothetical protein DMF72_13325 [Acidobacteriota bacterium]
MAQLTSSQSGGTLTVKIRAWIHPPSTPLTGTLDNAAPLRLGVRSFSLNGYWKGTLDELELFNRALTESEVFAIYDAGRVGKCSKP